MPDIKHQIAIAAAPEQVYQAITEQHGLEGWWTREVSAKAETGHVNVFLFGGANRTEMKVTALSQARQVDWQCLKAEGIDEWVGTRLTFDLVEQRAATIVRFSHSNWQARTALFAVFEEHWGGCMHSLKALCETGEGMPYGQAAVQGRVESRNDSHQAP